MNEFERIVAIESMMPLGIAWACLMRMHRHMRGEVAYLHDLAEAIETCRRMARAVGGEVEL